MTTSAFAPGNAFGSFTGGASRHQKGSAANGQVRTPPLASSASAIPGPIFSSAILVKCVITGPTKRLRFAYYKKYLHLMQVYVTRKSTLISLAPEWMSI